ncbi:hypothetical protein GSI_02537 [Ganoderma sinense ZZ0214-1]|uniref:Uncharacterized protein n=1 Tax=Ganoderma sinense ZZ0214-1 TaxID=1077348 RepID=A0A2G8SLX9_9APHY|nr:hypothetical protein GSI_02537 [Ganoderma sinense ZZ0214-1]
MLVNNLAYLRLSCQWYPFMLFDQEVTKAIARSRTLALTSVSSPLHVHHGSRVGGVHRRHERRRAERSRRRRGERRRSLRRAKRRMQQRRRLWVLPERERCRSVLLRPARLLGVINVREGSRRC